MKHRAIVMVLSLALMLTDFLPGGQLMAEAVEASDIFFSYTNHGDHIEITGAATPYIRNRNGHFSYGMTIPEEIDGLPVTEIADGGLSGIRMYQIIWPEWITTIPANCFQDCRSLETIILPETLERIDANAFAGCDALRDVLYKGDDAGWDALSVGAGNSYLHKAHILTNFNRASSRDMQFVFGEDDWSFQNGDLTAYLLSEEAVENYLEGCHPSTIDKSKTMSFPAQYMGACSGFALASYLVCCGILEPSDIYAGAETLHDIPLCQESVEAICYCFQRATRGHLMEAVSPEMEIDYIESGALLSDLEQGRPVWFSYFIPELGGHAVVAYGVEEGTWEYHDTAYTSRILVYDNNKEGFQEEACIYYNGDFEDMYIPYWESGVSFSGFIHEPDRIPYGIRSGTAYQSAYVIGDPNQDNVIDAVDAAEILTAAPAEGAGSDSGFVNGQRHAADVNADGMFNAQDAALILQYAAYAGAGGELSFEAFCPSPDTETIPNGAALLYALSERKKIPREDSRG